MVALASITLMRHDAGTLHAMVLRQLRMAKQDRISRVLLESVAEEAQALYQGLMRQGVPEHLDLLADACCDLLEHGTGATFTISARTKARRDLRDACAAMRLEGIEAQPIEHILALARLARRMPRLSSCTPAHIEVLAAPITRLLLHLFGS